MSFQLQSSPEGIAIPINDLDKEASEFWKVDFDSKHYAHPFVAYCAPSENHYTNNWFDTIGWAIHHPEMYTKGWNDVRCTLWIIQAKSLYANLYSTEAFNKDLENIRKFLQPYYELIAHWESKGYKPVRIPE